MKNTIIAWIFIGGVALFLGLETVARCAEGQGGQSVLTPQPPEGPLVNGPKVYGVRPGSPFLYRIPATGRRPMAFSAAGLPEGLVLDAREGIITGRVARAGTYRVVLSARNDRGEDQRPFRIVVGSQLALTPPMGWNSWYIHYGRVSEKIMREAADQMIASGMADYGYQYVNIDGCWQMHIGAKDAETGGPPRDAAGRLQPNRRFSDMKALTDYIHAKGLKAGIYTSPGPTDCAGFTGSYQHEAQDARTFAQWGFDFLKYDWCSYGQVATGKDPLDKLQKPYRLMHDIVQQQPRDIVLNLCQYGMGDVWRWGGQVGNCWRTTGDLGMEPARGLPGFYTIGLSNARHWQYAGPGAWNDPDYILIGWVGNAATSGVGRPTTLTHDEQYSYMSMWCLMAAPLIFSGDMARLDPFTLGVLCNRELIDVDQDVLGHQAKIIRKTPDALVLAKDLEDGSKAVGIFNLAAKTAKLSVAWSELGLTGKQRLRDLWRQKDLPVQAGAMDGELVGHGVAVIRLWPTP